MKLDIKEKLKSYVRVLSIAKKARKEELIFISKITAIGMIVIGIIGFIIYLFSILFLG